MDILTQSIDYDWCAAVISSTKIWIKKDINITKFQGYSRCTRRLQPLEEYTLLGAIFPDSSDAVSLRFVGPSKSSPSYSSGTGIDARW